MKKMTVITIAIISILSLASCSNETDQEATITLEEAKMIAFADANVTEENIVVLTATNEVNAGATYYDIEFYDTTTEYDYEIDATTGDILNKDTDIEDYQLTGTNQEAIISLEVAKMTAITDAQVEAATVMFSETELQSDGKAYEIKFNDGINEYEYKIDAITGAIIEKEKN